MEGERTAVTNPSCVSFHALFRDGFENLLPGRFPLLNLARVLAGLLVSWWFYVPVHELLHALGCWIGGGRVSRLEIDGMYGGQILAQWFPFVHSGSDYGGRLVGFDTGGSDWVYALTVGLPFVLVVPGVALMRKAVFSRNQLLFGAGIPLALSPLLSLTGDYLELGSLLTYQFWPGSAGAHRDLISDDLFRLIGEQWKPGGLVSGLEGWAFVVSSQITGLLLALATMAVADRLTRFFLPGSLPSRQNSESL